jgi:hypothetical protein
LPPEQADKMAACCIGGLLGKRQDLPFSHGHPNACRSVQFRSSRQPAAVPPTVRASIRRVG